MVCVGKEGEKWSEISRKEFQKMIAETVPILYEVIKAKERDIPLAKEDKEGGARG